MIAPARTPETRTVLVQWLSEKLRTTADELVGTCPFEIIGVLRNDYLMGAVLYNNYRYGRIEMACGGEPGWLTRPVLRDVFAYPFNQLGCTAVMTTVVRGNKTVREFNKKLGFREMCILPGASKADELALYCMTRKDCRWLPKPQLH